MSDPDPVATPAIETTPPRRPARSDRSHKGDFGRVLLIAGSRGMSGAATLAALGALRSGAGLVRVAAPATAAGLVATGEPSLMTLPLPEDADGQIDDACWSALEESLRWCDVAAAGPGLGQSSGVARVVDRLCDGFAGPLVLDADALNALAAGNAAALLRRARESTVLTPHPGEIARLCRTLNLSGEPGGDDDARRRCAQSACAKTGAIVVLKGHRTVVASRSRCFVNSTGNPGMAAGGMGDVLTGAVAALIAQRLNAFDAAALAVFAHGLAADRLSRRIAACGYLAREVADELPAALQECDRAPIGFSR